MTKNENESENEDIAEDPDAQVEDDEMNPGEAGYIKGAEGAEEKERKEDDEEDDDEVK